MNRAPFADGNTEAQSCKMTFPQPHGWPEYPHGLHHSAMPTCSLTLDATVDVIATEIIR